MSFLKLGRRYSEGSITKGLTKTVKSLRKEFSEKEEKVKGVTFLKEKKSRSIYD